jgi:hypothetical protein
VGLGIAERLGVSLPGISLPLRPRRRRRRRRRGSERAPRAAQGSSCCAGGSAWLRCSEVAGGTTTGTPYRRGVYNWRQRPASTIVSRGARNIRTNDTANNGGRCQALVLKLFGFEFKPCNPMVKRAYNREQSNSSFRTIYARSPWTFRPPALFVVSRPLPVPHGALLARARVLLPGDLVPLVGCSRPSP